jgi:DNA-directed RNA polymerase subunit RPC12/RpoP
MEIAITREGKEILASVDSPKEALCPLCGHKVVLRKRRLMNKGGTIYFWRHVDGGSLSCRARSSSAYRRRRG